MRSWITDLQIDPCNRRNRPFSDHVSFSFGEQLRVAGRAIQLECASMLDKWREAIIRIARAHAERLEITGIRRRFRDQGEVSPDAGEWITRNYERNGTIENVSTSHNCQHLILNPARQHLAALHYGIDVRKVLHQFFTEGFQSVARTNTTDRGSFNR